MHLQLSEQIVFLISTGQIRAAEQLPSVRSLARRLDIHHNTVSRAYVDLVKRGWLKRRQGSRLYVQQDAFARRRVLRADLDELINESILRAREMGHSLQELRAKVLERLSAEPPDHILVVEEEPELGEILRTEIYEHLRKPVERCSPEQFLKTPGIAIGALIVVPEYAVYFLKEFEKKQESYFSLPFSGADEHISLIRNLQESSTIAVASISKAMLSTARSLLAPALGKRHSLKEVLVRPRGRVDLSGADITFCDSVTMRLVRCRRKINYRLIGQNCLNDLATSIEAVK